MSVCLDADDAGRQFADADSDVQAAFLAGMSQAIDQWKRDPPKRMSPNWPMQCRFIADEMTEERRREVANLLDVLLDHLRGD